MPLLWSAILLLLASFAELTTATYCQALLPFFLLTTFYLNVSAPRALPCLAGAVLLDLAFARTFPVTFLPAIAAILTAWLWKRSGHLKNPLLQTLPALLLSALSALSLILYAGEFSRRILLSQLAAALLFPLLLLVLDAFASRGRLPRYQNAHERK